MCLKWLLKTLVSHTHSYAWLPNFEDHKNFYLLGSIYWLFDLFFFMNVFQTWSIPPNRILSSQLRAHSVQSLPFQKVEEANNLTSQVNQNSCQNNPNPNTSLSKPKSDHPKSTNKLQPRRKNSPPNLEYLGLTKLKRMALQMPYKKHGTKRLMMLVKGTELTMHIALTLHLISMIRLPCFSTSSCTSLILGSSLQKTSHSNSSP